MKREQKREKKLRATWFEGKIYKLMANELHDMKHGITFLRFHPPPFSSHHSLDLFRKHKHSTESYYDRNHEHFS